MMWYVGLDWADTHHDVAVLDESGKPVGVRRFSHSPQGLNDWKQFVWSFTSHPEELACIVETNHGLLIAFLLTTGIPVYPVNPNRNPCSGAIGAVGPTDVRASDSCAINASRYRSGFLPVLA